jgi:hypothetical protein
MLQFAVDCIWDPYFCLILFVRSAGQVMVDLTESLALLFVMFMLVYLLRKLLILGPVHLMIHP